MVHAQQLTGFQYARCVLKGLAILDVSDPFTPVLIGTYNTDHSSIRDVRVEGDRAYVLCEGQGLVVLDITNPTSPTSGTFLPGTLRRMTKVGNLLYVVDAWNGFTIIDVANPAAPRWSASTATSGTCGTRTTGC